MRGEIADTGANRGGRTTAHRVGELAGFFLKPVIIAIVIQALWSLGSKAVKGALTGMVGTAVIVLSFLGVNPVLLLFAGGLLVMALSNLRRAWAGRVGAIALVGAFVRKSKPFQRSFGAPTFSLFLPGEASYIDASLL